MKHQYYGDEKDLYKYAILRMLSKHYKSVGINWMLTENDNTNQGNRIEWMINQNHPIGDNQLHVSLRKQIFPDYIDNDNPGLPKAQNEKRIDWFLEDGLLPNGIEFSEFIKIGVQREFQHRKAIKLFEKCDLVFFDPDIGIEVSKMEDSRNYLMLSELKDYQDKDILVFQYIAPQGGTTGRLNRICSLSNQLCTSTNNIFIIEVPNIVTFLYILKGIWAPKLKDLMSQNLYKWRSKFKFGALNRNLANHLLRSKK